MMAKNHIVKTRDNSDTIKDERTGEHYHSTYGAISESKHVFIDSGLRLFSSQNQVNIFEVGFGTGLNALLSYQWAEQNQIKINYSAVELYPVPDSMVVKLNYPEMLGADRSVFEHLHKETVDKIKVSRYFHLLKNIASIHECILPENHFGLVFFDAFSPDVQPEMWTEEVFKKLSKAMEKGGVLSTYSCKGTVKRALKSAGFSIEKLPGPEGKREILRAKKL